MEVGMGELGYTPFFGQRHKGTSSIFWEDMDLDHAQNM
jgi:hypothetical protein